MAKRNVVIRIPLLLPMAYSNFSLNSVKHSFDLTIEKSVDLFAQIEAIASSDLLKTLKETIPLVSAINTQKARSKLNYCSNSAGGQTVSSVSSYSQELILILLPKKD